MRERQIDREREREREKEEKRVGKAGETSHVNDDHLRPFVHTNYPRCSHTRDLTQH